MYVNSTCDTNITLYVNRNLFLKFFKFIYSFWDRQTVSKGGPRERERKNPKQSPYYQHGPDGGLKLMKHETMTRDKMKSLTLNQLSYPGAPTNWNLNKNLKKKKEANTGFFTMWYPHLWGFYLIYSQTYLIFL